MDNRTSQQKWYEERGRAYYKQYYIENKERIRQYHKQYYEKNRERLRKKQNQYHKDTYYSKGQSYFRENYRKKREEILIKAQLWNQYGNRIVNVNEGRFIVSFK